MLTELLSIVYGTFLPFQFFTSATGATNADPFSRVVLSVTVITGLLAGRIELVLDPTLWIISPTI